MVEFTGERVIPGFVDRDLMNEHLARYAFAARLARGKRVLDAGCGTGYGAAELAKTAYSVVGVDSAADALSYAREQYRLPTLRFEQASCSALPHPDASFDLVVAFEVIEHLPDWREFLMEMRRVLAPAGQFIVSTPNRLYYAESRGASGPNPFHVHEFDFAEFGRELSSVFPNISLYLQNHVDGVAFQPVEPAGSAEVRVDGAEPDANGAHFFVAICSHRTQAPSATFIYLPSASNVLKERERHIQLLEGWLEAAKGELAELNQQHSRLLAEMEERNRWAQDLDQKLAAAGKRVVGLQEELKTVTAGYEAKIAELHEEDRKKTEWAIGLDKQLREKTAELDQFHQSRWVRLGRQVGLGPKVPLS